MCEDPAAGHIEMYRPLEGLGAHGVEKESVSWTSVPGGPGRVIDVPPLFRGFE